jgi:Flp pilus assembly pilin Flp
MSGMISVLREVWRQDEGQDVAEYAVMLAVMLTIAVGTVRLIGSHASDVFSSIGSSIQ